MELEIRENQVVKLHIKKTLLSNISVFEMKLIVVVTHMYYCLLFEKVVRKTEKQAWTRFHIVKMVEPSLIIRKVIEFWEDKIYRDANM